MRSTSVPLLLLPSTSRSGSGPSRVLVPGVDSCMFLFRVTFSLNAEFPELFLFRGLQSCGLSECGLAARRRHAACYQGPANMMQMMAQMMSMMQGGQASGRGKHTSPAAITTPMSMHKTVCISTRVDCIGAVNVLSLYCMFSYFLFVFLACAWVWV